MSFTYDLATTVGKIRLHVDDTSDGTGSQAKLTDEEINYAITEGGGTLGGGVVKAIQFLMAKVAQASFKADWLEVDNDTAFKSLSALLALKRREFGITVTANSSVAYAWRPDSDLSEAPTFDSTDDDS